MFHKYNDLKCSISKYTFEFWPGSQRFKALLMMMMMMMTFCIFRDFDQVSSCVCYSFPDSVILSDHFYLPCRGTAALSVNPCSSEGPIILSSEQTWGRTETLLLFYSLCEAPQETTQGQSTLDRTSLSLSSFSCFNEQKYIPPHSQKKTRKTSQRNLKMIHWSPASRTNI